MTMTAQTRQRTQRRYDRDHINRRLRRVMLVTAMLDAMVLSCSVVLAWTARDLFHTRFVLARIPEGVPVRAGAFLVVVWLLALAVQGGYNKRNFGAGTEEFRVVGLASVITAGLIGLTCYTFQIPLSRGFVLFAFVIGGPLLLSERYAVRKWAHGIRLRGKLIHRVLAVGGPSGVSEVVEALARNGHVGYHIVGACVPDGITGDPDRFPVPVVGGLADARRMCDDLGADTVLVARGAYDSALDLRRIAWDLEGSTIELVVVPSLTDVAGPRIHMRPVAGLPLLHVEQPQADNAGGLSKRLFDMVFASAALMVLSPLLLVVALVVKLHDGGPVLLPAVPRRAFRGPVRNDQVPLDGP